MPVETLECVEKMAWSRAANRIVFGDRNNTKDATEDDVISLDSDESGDKDHEISDVSDGNQNQGDMQENLDGHASEPAAQHSTVPAQYPATEAAMRLAVKKEEARQIKPEPIEHEPAEYGDDKSNGDEAWLLAIKDDPADQEGRCHDDRDPDWQSDSDDEHAGTSPQHSAAHPVQVGATRQRQGAHLQRQRQRRLHTAREMNQHATYGTVGRRSGRGLPVQPAEPKIALPERRSAGTASRDTQAAGSTRPRGTST